MLSGVGLSPPVPGLGMGRRQFVRLVLLRGIRGGSITEWDGSEDVVTGAAASCQ